MGNFVRFGFHSDLMGNYVYKINGGDLTVNCTLIEEILVEILQSLITFPLGARRSTIASIKDL